MGVRVGDIPDCVCKQDSSVDVDVAAFMRDHDGLSILEEAFQLTRGQRNVDYGHPADDFGRTAAMWSAILGVEVTASQAILCMAAVKISRLCATPDHHDSWTDLAGYADCGWRVQEREQETVITHNA